MGSQDICAVVKVYQLQLLCNNSHVQILVVMFISKAGGVYFPLFI